jgi:branched-chain amino acid transport system ATP-binding protein
MSTELLEIEGLHAYYGKSHVLQGVNLRVSSGELTVVVGRNGMGKTTLLRSVLGLPPVLRRGRILFVGREIAKLSTHEIAAMGVGYVPQGRLLFPSLTVDEHLRFAFRNKRRGGEWTPEKVYDLFPELKERVKLGGARLSGGEQQMLAIGRALVTNPMLLMMDEPSEGLSKLVINRVEHVCSQLRASGMSILLVEQNLDMAKALADRAYVFLNGLVAYEASGETFRKEMDIVRGYLGI